MNRPNMALSVPEPILLQPVFRRHGGLARWQSVRYFDVEFSSGGLAFAAKFQGQALRRQRARVFPQPQGVHFSGFPRGLHAEFDRGAVRIVSGAGAVLHERPDARAQFNSFRHLFWWDALDMTYFAGYALWNYLCFPFNLLEPGVSVREIDHGSDYAHRCLEVTFPDSLHVHSRLNRFYLGTDGLLRRHDYTAEVIGRFARAAHLCDAVRDFDGFPIATRRRVYPALGSSRLPAPLLVWIDIHDVRPAFAQATPGVSPDVAGERT